MGSCAAPSAKGDDKFITTDYLQQCLSKRPPKSAQISYLFDHDSGAILYFSRRKVKKH